MTSKTQDKSIIPPEGTKNVGPAIFQLLHKVVKDKTDIGLHGRIQRNHQLKMGEHWKQTGTGVPLVVVNLIWNHIQKNQNLLTDNNPVFNCAKVGEIPLDQEDSIDLIQRTAEHWWNETDQQAVFEDTVNYGEEYGATIEYTRFNKDLEFGMGEVETLNVDPLFFGFYPPELKNPRQLQQQDALFFYYPKSVREIKRTWPDTSSKVKGDEDLIQELGDERRAVGHQSDSESKFFGALISIASEIKQMLNFKFGADGKEDETLVVECWCKDYTEIELEPEEGSNEQRFQPKYPGYIRRIITCNGGKVVLSDEENPSINPTLIDEKPEDARNCYLYDKYPFYMRNSCRDTSNAWGFADIEQLEKLNTEVNKCFSQLTLIKDRKARSKIVNPMDSGVDNDEFTNTAGIIRPSNSMVADGIRFLTFDGDMNDFVQSIELYKDIFYTIAGTFELDQAATPGKNVIAYKAIAALIEQASTMRKGKIRSYSGMIENRGRCYISLAQNWYTEDRWITYKQDGTSESQMITRDNLLFPVKLTVVTGSTLPVSKVQKREEAVALFDKGVIDQEALLEDLDWTNRKAILERMKGGPFGVLLNRLLDLQMPEGLAEYIKELGMMDSKDFQRAAEKGELPQFPQMLKQLITGEEPPNPEQDMKQQEVRAKALESSKKAEKIDAEITLIQEKVKTEKVEQYVKMEGVNLDRESIKIERLKAINDIASAEMDKAGKAGYNERGMTSNNKD